MVEEGTASMHALLEEPVHIISVALPGFKRR